MKNSDYPGLNFDFAYKLTNESERGAILIGASKIETYLEKLILSILPIKTKKYSEKLLNYPGVLSSFSGKIELCFAFRVIDEKVYNALTALRKIRNSAAHSNETFSFQELNGELEKIYEFEYGFPEVVHELTFKHLLNWKTENARQALIKNNLADYDFETLWNETLPDPEKNETFQEHLRVWKLAYGLTLLCLKIEVIRDEWISKNEANETGSNTYTKVEKQQKHTNAYEPWTPEADEKLELLFCKGKTIKELTEIFGRNDGAIRSRIKKLELKEKYDR
ncbi:MAG: hypothetical protein ACTHMM_13345 [Agriterribacter sp.]